jgi:DNA-binding NarL/FixJ family response regulator
VRCLLVDDNSAFIETARLLLAREGVVVAGTASSIAEALRQASALRPDVVLVDIALGADHAGRVESFGGMVRRHPDVHDGQLRLMLPDQRDELRPVTGLPGHDEAGPLEQAGQALPEEDVIVGQRDPDAGLGHPY